MVFRTSWRATWLRHPVREALGLTNQKKRREKPLHLKTAENRALAFQPCSASCQGEHAGPVGPAEEGSEALGLIACRDLINGHQISRGPQILDLIPVMPDLRHRLIGRLHRVIEA